MKTKLTLLALLLLSVAGFVVTACSDDDKGCYLGIVKIVPETGDSYFVKLSEVPNADYDYNRPRVNQWVIFKQSDLPIKYKEGDAVSFTIEKSERYEIEEPTTGDFVQYQCVVKPCK